MRTEYIVLLIGIGLSAFFYFFAPEHMGWGLIFALLPMMVLCAEFIDERLKKLKQCKHDWMLDDCTGCIHCTKCKERG